MGAGTGTPPTERRGGEGRERERRTGGRGECGLGFYEFGESFVLGPRRFLFGSRVLACGRCCWCDAVAHGVRSSPELGDVGMDPAAARLDVSEMAVGPTDLLSC